jgi:hypothetical protein
MREHRRARVRRRARRGAEARLRRGRSVLRRRRHRRRAQARDPRRLAFGPAGGFRRVHVEGIRTSARSTSRSRRARLPHQAARHRAADRARARAARASLHGAARDADRARRRRVQRGGGEGDFVGRVVLEGRGAGAGPTASAVVADLIDIARGRASRRSGVPAGGSARAPAAPMDRHRGAYYLRLMVATGRASSPTSRRACATSRSASNPCSSAAARRARRCRWC